MKQKKALRMLSALAQDTRVNIFRLLVKEGKKGLSAGVVAEILQVPAATLSFHLSQMSNAGLLKSYKIGRTVMYSAKKSTIKKLAAFLLEGAEKNKDKKNGENLIISDDDDLEDDIIMKGIKEEDVANDGD